jgi:hypothetical protein
MILGDFRISTHGCIRGPVPTTRINVSQTEKGTVPASDHAKGCPYEDSPAGQNAVTRIEDCYSR